VCPLCAHARVPFLQSHESQGHPHIAHNIALSKFAQSDCRSAPELVLALGDILSRDDGSAHDKMPSHDLSVIRYNYAVALFQCRQFAEAEAELHTVVSSASDEMVAMRAAFQLLDVYAAAYCGSVAAEVDIESVYAKAMEVIAWLEEPHVFNGGRKEGGSRRSDGVDTGVKPIQVVRGVDTCVLLPRLPSLVS